MINKINFISKFKELKTPFYFYNTDILKNTLASLSKSILPNNKVHYAIKANSNKRLLEIIKEYSLGIDAVSYNEIRAAINCGFKSKDIVFAGVGKSDEEIINAIKNKISYFNCESLEEIKVIDGLSKTLNVKTNVSIRINPNIQTNTHKNIQTGSSDDKFGIDVNSISDILTSINRLNNISIVGIHFHIGSQIRSHDSFLKLSVIANDLNNFFYERNYDIKIINVGGGLSIDYDNPLENIYPEFKSFFNIYNDNIKLRKNQNIHFELGRSIVGQCGFLISRVLFEKESFNNHFIILDSGMNNLIRPALYNASHKIINISSSISTIKNYNIVGPLCESSDTFAENYPLIESKRGDMISICSAGAYGESMSSNYNLREDIKSYFSDTI